MSFEQLGLDSRLLKAVKDSGFQQPTDIQRQAIPLALAGKDLMASAQTGTGKTAAFVLPSLHRLLKPAMRRGAGPRVLVLTPTRELALQISDAVAQFGRFSRLTTGDLVGGMPYPPQIRMLGKPLDLLVATPGRLLDHMSQGRVNFSRLEVLILDEADRMLDMGFIEPVKTIAAAVPAARQTLLFSATLEGQVLTIAKALMKNPERIQLAANRDRHAMITQRIYQADDAGHKRKLLDHHLVQDELTQALVFTATKRGARRMAKLLDAQGHASAALHGDMSQSARKRTVERMRRGKIRVLVATDVAARGLDIRSISHVINFDLPMVAEDYIHRIGRTGRAQASGTAISLVTPDDRSKLSQIERVTGRKLERGVIVGLEPNIRTLRNERGSKRKPTSGPRSGSRSSAHNVKKAASDFKNRRGNSTKKGGPRGRPSAGRRHANMNAQPILG
ncbi:MAG: DEAD/DEAH box helicase [Gammaproteobacteria bacterium]|nr:DEAD/DEAH box helicase [Gammaproteobacteria bacterium]